MDVRLGVEVVGIKRVTLKATGQFIGDGAFATAGDTPDNDDQVTPPLKIKCVSTIA